MLIFKLGVFGLISVFMLSVQAAAVASKKSVASKNTPVSAGVMSTSKSNAGALGPSVLPTAASGQAAPQPIDEASEKEVVKRVKRRTYPGGRDEEDLKVQAHLPGNGRKAKIESAKPAQETD